MRRRLTPGSGVQDDLRHRLGLGATLDGPLAIQAIDA